MGRKRTPVSSDSGRYKAKKEPVPETARAYGSDIYKASKEVKPIQGEYVVRIRKNELTIEGEGGQTSSIYVSGGGNVDTLVDSQTVKAFQILKGPVVLEQRGDNLRVVEAEGKNPTAFSINIRKPREDFATRETTYVNWSGGQTAVTDAKTNGVIAVIERDRDGEYSVFQGHKPKVGWGQPVHGRIRASSLKDAKRIAANL